MTLAVEPGADGPSNLPRTMRAAVLMGPNDLRVVEQPLPTPGPGEVLVRVAMCGTCGSDLKIVAHGLPNQPPFGEFIPGHEWTGTVAGLGPTVDELAVGERVAIQAHRGCMRCDNCLLGLYTACLNYGDTAKGHRATGITAAGGFAEYVVHHVSSLYRLPDNLTWEDAVLVMTAGTSLYGLDVTGGYIAGETVVVIGPGPIGLMTVQVCKAVGAGRVILTGTRPSRLELGARLGADVTINAREADVVATVMRLTDGRGADLVIETAGAAEAPQQCVELVRRGGKILILAFYEQPISFDLSRLVREGICLYTSRGEGGNNVKRGLALAAQGKLRGHELVSHRFPLEQINEGFRVVREREGDPMKVVFVP